MTISDAAQDTSVSSSGTRNIRFRAVSEVAGMIFFNDEGTGTRWPDIRRKARTRMANHRSFGHLSFDNYEQDQVMIIEANQEDTGT